MSEYKEKCPICGKCFDDILKHVSVHHNIRNMEELGTILKQKEEDERERQAFRKYIDELDERLKKKEITIEQYRELKSRWFK